MKRWPDGAARRRTGVIFAYINGNLANTHRDGRLIRLRRAGVRIICLGLCTTLCAACAFTRPVSAKSRPEEVLDLMERVADWQLAHPSKHDPATWTQCAGYTGFMALASISSKAGYHDAMIAMGEKNGWQLGTEGNRYHADEHCVGQGYGDRYSQHRE